MSQWLTITQKSQLIPKCPWFVDYIEIERILSLLFVVVICLLYQGLRGRSFHIGKTIQAVKLHSLENVGLA